MLNWKSKERLPLLFDHGIEGFAYSVLRTAQNPSVPLEPLKNAWNAQWVLNLAYLEELDWFENQCKELGISAIVLKGAALLDDIYPDLGSRSMADVDLWVEEKHWDIWIDLLLNRGYDLVASNRWEANSFKSNFSRWNGGLELVIEVHRRLFYQEGRQMNWQLEPFKNGALKKLAREEMLAHLAGHLGYQHTFLKLSWLIDIDRYIRKHGQSLDWARLMQILTQLQHRRSASAVLWAAKKYFGTEIDDHMIESLGGFCSKIWQNMITEEFLWKPTQNQKRYYLLKHLMKDSFRAALEYDWNWVKGKAWK